MKEVRIALCQIEVIAGDREGNLSRISEAAKLAVDSGAAIAVFPESAILGWINPEAHRLAHPIPGTDTDRLCELAKSLSIAIIVGLDEKDGDYLYGSAVVISKGGVLMTMHRKHNVLSELMQPSYSTGETRKVTVAQIGDVKVGLLICADTFDEGLVTSASNADVDFLAVPYGWVAPHESWPNHGESLRELVSSLAMRVGCPVIGVDGLGTVPAGPWAGRKYCGASCAADATGKQLFDAKFAEPFVKVVDLEI